MKGRRVKVLSRVSRNFLMMCSRLLMVISSSTPPSVVGLETKQGNGNGKKTEKRISLFLVFVSDGAKARA